jgi:hypothetical protein
MCAMIVWPTRYMSPGHQAKARFKYVPLRDDDQ